MRRIFCFLYLTFSILGLNAQTLKVISYNIHHGTNAAEEDYLAEMASLIKKTGAELIGLQEVDSMCNRSGKVDQMKKLAELTGMHYAFARHFAYDGGAYGQGILSKYPIVNSENIRISLLKKDGSKDTRALLKASVSLPGNQQIVFASVHCALDAPSRMIQSNEILAALNNDEIPVILTGDFNTLPDTPEVKNLAKWFQQADLQQLPTFPAEKPVKKIDYIFISRKFLNRIKSYRVFDKVGYSDHAPVLAKLKLNSD